MHPLAPKVTSLHLTWAVAVAKLTAQAKSHCMGILQGIHHFETESESEYKDWAVDAPGEYFVSVYQDWRKGAKNNKDVSEVKRFVQALCPTRAKWCK